MSGEDKMFDATPPLSNSSTSSSSQDVRLANKMGESGAEQGRKSDDRHMSETTHALER
eukprot:gene358-386_t